MISVLVPTYNYKVGQLITAIHHQLSNLTIPFEIICMEDGSDPESIEANASIQELSNTHHLISEDNHGRLETRILLCNHAKHEWILFLDADTSPKSDEFIKNYLNAISDSTEAIFGGFAYYQTPPEHDFLLRWRYGRKFEARPAIIRNKKPYKVIISANFLIKKSVFESLDLKKHNGLYGYDSYFGGQLKSHNVNVVHIDNEVFHLGLEPNLIYLNKKEQAAQTLLFLHNNHYMDQHDNGLLKVFRLLKSIGMNHLVGAIFRGIRNKLTRNLIGTNPSIYLLQFYKIGYLCYIDKYGIN